MEYDDVIQILGELGTYQKLVLFSLSFAMAFRAYPTFIANFIAGSHSHRYVFVVFCHGIPSLPYIHCQLYSW